MRIAHSGRARVSIRRPKAIGECDICAFWVSRDALSSQYQWSGNSLNDTGLLVCSDCLDVPQDQFRNPILPPDPRPIIQPRPSGNVTPFPYTGQPLPTTPANLGFTSYNIGAPQPGLYISTTDGSGVLGELILGSGVLGADDPVLLTVLGYAGIAKPRGLSRYVQLMPRNVSTWILSPDDGRTFLLLYNPNVVPVQLALAPSVATGTVTNLLIGPGQAFLWATSQMLGTVYQGSIAAVSQYGANLPLWFWTDDGAGFWDDGGWLAFVDLLAADGWPTSSDGLLPGAVWQNGLTLAVVPGVTPNPTADPVYFGGITPPQLLLLGGGNLPLTSGPDGTLQLWNDNGVVSVSDGPPGFASDSGVMIFSYSPTGWPTSPIGLAAGAVWNNGGTISVVAGLTPDPTAQPIFVYSISQDALLALGGGNLPLTKPTAGSLQLWNNSGSVNIA